MKNYISEFHETFNQYTAQNIKYIEESSFHIFSFILEAYSSDISVDERMKMCLHFHSYEKSLAKARAGNLQQAKFWIDYVSQSPKEFTGSVQMAMDSLYYAMIAYYKFSKKEYRDAVIDLQKAIQLASITMEKEGLNIMLTSCFEQNLNICRVYYSMKDYPMAYNESSKLLLFMNTGKSLLTHNIMDVKALEKLDKGKHVMMLRYVTNTLLSKVLKNVENDSTNEKEIYERVLRELWEQEDWALCPIDGYKDAVMALKNYFEEDFESFFNNVSKMCLSLATIPSILQFIVLNKASILAEKFNYEKNASLLTELMQYYDIELKLHSSFTNPKLLVA
jgi:tetratricopeptide (TPR) repeat protein